MLSRAAKHAVEIRRLIVTLSYTYEVLKFGRSDHVTETVSQKQNQEV